MEHCLEPLRHSGMPKLATVMFAQRWATVPVAVKRGIGLLFDWICVVALCSGPLMLHQFTNKVLLSDEILGPSNAAFGGSVILCALTWSPLPLICLRLFCRCILRQCTPGEMLCGYFTATAGAKGSNFVQQAGFALVEYLAVIVSLLVACIPAAVMALICVQFLFAVFGPRFGAFVASFLCFEIGYTVLMLSLVFTKVRADGLESVVDRICGLRVVEHGWFQASQQLKQAGPIDEAEC